MNIRLAHLLAAALLALGLGAISHWNRTVHELYASRDERPPIAVMGHTESNLGTIRQGGELRAFFPIRNAGQRRLILTQLQPGCECTAGNQQIIVAPGASVHLEVQTIAERAGNMRSEFHYATNAPNLPKLCLKITATVQKQQEVEFP